MIQVIYNKYNLMDAFFKLKQGKHIISIVGAGGKSSVMYSMAEWFEKTGKKTLVTTTTHIYKPKEDFRMDCDFCWRNHKYAVVGEADKDKFKKPDNLMNYLERADIVLIEADGSRHKPCKVPNENEPVLMEESDCVIGVIGLSAIHKPIQECCFRIEEVCKLLNKNADELLTIEDVIRIIYSSAGLKKEVRNRDFYVVLNQCDSEDELRYANEIAEKIQDPVIVTCLKEENYER